MKKLAISFMTYNRPKHIREDLHCIAQPAKEHGIDIYIFDGSTDQRTEQVVDQYREKGYDHIYYFHVDKQLSKKESVLQRCEDAFRMPDAEYVWMCGDKFVIRPEHYIKILEYIDKSYDIITIYGFDLKGTRKFNKVSGYADYAIVPLTLWGANIIKKKLVEPFRIGEEINKVPSFGIQSIYLQAIAKCQDFKGVVIDAGNQVNIGSRYKTRSGSQGYMWSAWVINWYRFIESLPEAYDDVREKLYNRMDLKMQFFSLRNLLRQRSEGQFGWQDCWKDRKLAQKVIVMPYVFVLGISLLPQDAAKRLWSVVDYIRETYAWIKNSVRLIGEKLR